MIARPLLSTLASAGIVLLAAWGLYPRSRPAASPEPPTVSPSGAANPAERVSPPTPTEGVAWRDGRDPEAAPVGQTQPKVSRLGTFPSRIGTVSKANRPTTTLAKSRQAASQPQSLPQRSATPAPLKPFTMAEPGEDLAAVAERVYGDREAAADLLRSNRDQVDDAGKVFVRRTILRTPPR